MKRLLACATCGPLPPDLVIRDNKRSVCALCGAPAESGDGPWPVAIERRLRWAVAPVKPPERPVSFTADEMAAMVGWG